MKNAIINLYSFEELSEEAQEKVLNTSQAEQDYEYWGDWILDNSIFKYNHLYYDLGRGQSIQFEGLDVINIDLFHELLKIPKKYAELYDYKFELENNTTTIILTDEMGLDPEGDLIEILDNAKEIFDEMIFKAWTSLRDDYEYSFSEESIKGTIEANEYVFDVHGNLEPHRDLEAPENDSYIPVLESDLTKLTELIEPLYRPGLYDQAKTYQVEKVFNQITRITEGGAK